VIVATLLIIAQAADGPAKMFIIANNGVTVTDYPSMARCEASKADLQRQADRENAATPTHQTTKNGGQIIVAPIKFRAVCFKG
jgi:hypothetical protein